MAKKKWSELSTQAKVGVVSLAAVEAVVTTIAARDLHGRTDAQVNGPRWLWRIAFFVQPFGPLGYLIFGRKR
jgi:hypothetical protein